MQHVAGNRKFYSQGHCEKLDGDKNSKLFCIETSIPGNVSTTQLCTQNMEQIIWVVDAIRNVEGKGIDETGIFWKKFNLTNFLFCWIIVATFNTKTHRSFINLIYVILSDFMKKGIKNPQSASELYRPRDRSLSAKLVSTFEDRKCRVVSATDPHDRILGSSSTVLTRLSAPRSRRTTSQEIWKRRESNPDLWICSQELWPLDHIGGLTKDIPWESKSRNMYM
jgi:hypothetical protein